MNTNSISWEIVVAGLTFIGIAIFLLNREDDRRHASRAASHPHHADTVSVPEPPIPPSIVIDLQNLENLKNLENLRNLKNLDNLKNLEVELQNLDKLIQEQEQTISVGESTQIAVEKYLRDFEKKLQQMEDGNFNIKLQDNKVFINRKFRVEEASWSEVSPGVYVYRKSLNLPVDGRMELDLGFGNVNVIGADTAGGEIVLQATGDIEDPGMLGRRLLMRMKRENREASVSVESDRGESFSDRINLEATVTVPRQTDIDVNTSGGHISVTHLRGNHDVKTSGGHITLDDLSGTISADTRGGHITGSRVDGELDLSTSGGHINLTRASGRVDLSTGGGHITREQITGAGEAKTSGGNISAAIQLLNGPVEFNTSAGNISLQLPRSVQADILIRGNRASIDNVFDFSGEQTEGRIEGTINGGGVPVSAHCGYGNVSINPTQ